MRFLYPRILFSLFFILLICSFSSQAFLNNNVRVHRFKWMVVHTTHFDLYYDQGTEPFVPRMAFYLEKAWEEVGEILDFKVPNRTPFFFYSNHNEFEQTNIVSIGEGTGGVTEALKNRFLIFNDGSEEWMRHVIFHEFGHVVQFNVLYGGFWKSARLLKSPFYALWMMEGMAEYVSGEIDAPAGDLVIRDAVAHHKLPLLAELQGFNHLKPNQVTLAYKTGEEAMKFLKEEFGPKKVGQLLNLVKDYFDVSTALENLIGCDLNRFDKRFHEWVQERYAEFLKNAKEPKFYGPQISHSDVLPQFNVSPVFSLDGKKVFFFSDRGGPDQLYEHTFSTKEEKALLGLPYSQIENIHNRGRALSISRDGRWLAFSGEKIQRDFLYLFDLKRKKLKRIKVPFDELRSPVFSPQDDNLVCVGMTKGFNDLYLMNKNGKVLDRLTNNPQSEKDPTFSPDGQRIIYSGEVLNPDRTPGGWDLFELNRQNKTSSRLAVFPGTESEPEVLPDNSLVFVRDRDIQGNYGFNFYLMSSTGSSVKQLTDFVGGGFSPRYNKVDNTLTYVAYHNMEKHIYRYEKLSNPSFSSTIDDLNPEFEGPGSPSRGDDFEEADWGDPPALPKPRVNTQISTLFPNINSSLVSGNPRPYRFKGSTDIFFPFFLYSTEDGLALVDLWQYSEMLGNHQFQQQMQYASGSDFLDLSLFYTYARFRPQFSLGLDSQRFYMDFSRQHQRRELNAIFITSYPLDRINAVLLGVGTTDKRELFFDSSEPDTRTTERFWTARFVEDTITGRYLVATKGQRLSFFYQQGVEVFNGEEEYKTGGLEAVKYFPLPRESTFASRIFYGRSTGQDAQVFRLGGSDRIRGISGSSLTNKKSNVIVGNTEFRLRLKYLNARTKFLFPDFFFKAAYLTFFDDFGYGYNLREDKGPLTVSHLENPAGLGVSWPTFVLQSFRLDFAVQWAHRTTDGGDVWYISLGPSF